MRDMAKHPYLNTSGSQGFLKYRRSVHERLRGLIGKHEIHVTFGSSVQK